MIKAIIFDMGGVLLIQNHKEIFSKFAKITKIEIWDNKAFWKLRSKLPTGRTTSSKAFSVLSTKEKSLKEIMKVYGICYEKFSPKNKEVFSLLNNLKKRYRLYLLSNTNPLHYSINKKRGVYKPFAKSFLSFKLRMKKPDKRFYRHALKDIRLKPEEVVFIDDQKKNIIVANELGMKGIIFEDCNQLVRDLKKLGIKC
ncbi:MAG: HAD family phosphatase [Nanoarchaeota archaeon]|nr:HAD family phosphatase [Nanoarchaeota archaeon]